MGASLAGGAEYGASRGSSQAAASAGLSRPEARPSTRTKADPGGSRSPGELERLLRVPRERIRVVGCWDLRRHRFVVGPQRDHEAVMLVDAWLRPRLQGSYRTPGFGEPQS